MTISQSTRKLSLFIESSDAMPIDTPDAILNSISINMTISLMQATVGSNAVVFRSCVESVLEVLKRAPPSTFASVVPGSAHEQTLRSLTIFAEDIAAKTKGTDRSLAISLILGVAFASGSLQDVLKTAQLLMKGRETLHERAYTFFKLMTEHVVDWEMISPLEKSVLENFPTRVVIKRRSKYLHATPSLTSDGSYLYIWNGHNCTVSKVGNGFHGTVAGMYIFIVR
jgi:hypothetical protein